MTDQAIDSTLTIGVDLDGVTYDFTASLRDYLVDHRGFVRAHLPEPIVWAHWDVWPLTKREWVAYFHEGIEAGVIFGGGTERLYPEAAETLGTLSAMGHRIHIITHRPPEAEGATVEWLRSVDIYHDALTFSADKTCEPVDVMLEDNIDNAIACAKAGIPVLLFDKPWNTGEWEHEGVARDARVLVEEYPLIRRVDGWTGAYHAIYDLTNPMPPPLKDIIDTANPKDRLGLAKPAPLLVPPAALIEMSMAMANGAAKYGAYNWRTKEVLLSVYLNAAVRHILQCFDGEERASDSGVKHLAHAMACLGIVMDAEANGMLVDDRPPPGSAAHLIEAYTLPS